MADRYNPRVIDHLVRPRRVGEVSEASGVGESGDAACGDVARFSVKIESNVLTDVRYKVYGCAACIAAGSALAELVNGEPLLDAARVSKQDLQEALGGPLPLGKEHALTLVLDALHKAFEDHLNCEAGDMLVEGHGGAAKSGAKGVVAAMSGGGGSPGTGPPVKGGRHQGGSGAFWVHDGEKGG